MAKYVAILHDGVLTVHLPHTTGDYYTLCGEDGADDDPHVDSVAADVPKGARVNCHACFRIWEVCKSFTKKDFAASNKSLHTDGSHAPPNEDDWNEDEFTFN